jgi:hypothetical protein
LARSGDLLPALPALSAALGSIVRSRNGEARRAAAAVRRGARGAGLGVVERGEAHPRASTTSASGVHDGGGAILSAAHARRCAGPGCRGAGRGGAGGGAAGNPTGRRAISSANESSSWTAAACGRGGDAHSGCPCSSQFSSLLGVLGADVCLLPAQTECRACKGTPCRVSCPSLQMQSAHRARLREAAPHAPCVRVRSLLRSGRRARREGRQCCHRPPALPCRTPYRAACAVPPLALNDGTPQARSSLKVSPDSGLRQIDLVIFPLSTEGSRVTLRAPSPHRVI